MKTILPLHLKSLLALAFFAGWTIPLKAQTNAPGTNAAGATTTNAVTASAAASASDEPALPEGCANFSGSLRGKLVSADPQGKSFTVALVTVTPNDKNQATKPKDLEGKTVIVFPSNIQNAQGKWVQAKEDIAYISTLKEGQDILCTVYTRTAKPNRLFLDWYPSRSGKKTPSDS